MSYDHSAKAIRQKFKEKGVFYTDIKLAEVLKGYMPKDTTEVYDPTCGNGNLLSVFPDEIAKYGQELDPEQADVARHRLPNSYIATGDTLDAPAFLDKKFRAIVANPPFSVKWLPPMLPDERFSIAPTLPPPSKGDYAFLLHILHYLSDDGIAVVLSFPGILYRGQREGELRRWFVEGNYIDEVVYIEGDYFVDTKIATALVVLRKDRRVDAKVKFSELKTGRYIEVERSAVQANDCNLSPHIYIPEEKIDKPAFDPIEAEMSTRKGVVNNLRLGLSFSLWVSQYENIPFAPLLDELQEVITEYREKLGQEQLL